MTCRVAALPLAAASGLLLLLLLWASPAAAETHTDCGVAQTAFSFCVPYIAGMDRALPPKCCMGVRSLGDLAPPTAAGQRGMCECLKRELAAAGVVDGSRAAGLPGRCGVASGVVVPTGLDYDCSGVA